MTRAKICGLTRPADVDAAVRAGADAVGFVVDVPVETPRSIAADRARELIESVPPFVTTVAVTMPRGDASTLVDLASRTGADVVQVHDEMAPEDLDRVRTATGVQILKTVDAADRETAIRHDDVADALLVDSVDASGAGGTGETHDWDATAEVVEDVASPVVLAGGLTPENVGEAIDAVRPFAVDVASGVESRGGEKDHAAVEAFVANARNRVVAEP